MKNYLSILFIQVITSLRVLTTQNQMWFSRDYLSQKKRQIIFVTQSSIVDSFIKHLMSFTWKATTSIGFTVHGKMKKRFATVMFPLFTLMLFSVTLSGQSITGKVFFDGNNNGAFESANEVGFGGVTVTAYDATNAVKSTTTTALTGTLGSYTLSGLVTGTTYRVEFTLPNGYNDGSQATGSRSSVQFVTAGSTANLGVYTTGVCDRDKTVRVVAGCADTSGGSTSVASWDYFADRKTTIADGTINPHDDDMTFAQVGVPMGMGSRAKDKIVFLSTVSSPLTTVFPVSPGGSSAIYMANYSGTGNAYVSNKLLTKLSSLTPSINVSSQFNVGSVDNTGEYGLGGLDLTDDGKFLYVVNMGKGNIIKLDISGVTYATVPSGGYTGTGLPVSEITIPTTISACTGGRFRPSAIEIYAGSMYVGGICDASTSTTASNLRLKVLKMNLTTSVWSEILNFDLSTMQGGTLRYSGWPNVKWSDTFKGTTTTDGEIQPYVNDLAIDDYGAVIVGVTNRKIFSSNSDRDMGYILRTFRNADGTMTMENAGKAGPLTSAARTAASPPSPGLNTGSASNLNMVPFGPGKDWFFENGRTSSHPFLHTGGVYVLPGTKEVLSGFSDPLDGNTTAGARYLGYDDGVTNYGISLTDVKVFALTGADAVCEPSNIEIGNFVWKDTNQNGRQDAGETPLAGVTVKLKSSNGATTIATATTDANGNYIFSNATGTSTASFIYGLTGLTALTSYKLSIDGYATQTPLAGLGITVTNVTANGEDQRDNDAIFSGGNAEIIFTTKEAGANNHTLDVGFTPAITFNTASTDAMCTGVTAKSDGSITLSAYPTGAKYQYCLGNTFVAASAIPTTPTAIPTGGVIVSNLPNPAVSQVYTIRVFDGTNSAIFLDKNEVLEHTDCLNCGSSTLIASWPILDCNSSTPGSFFNFPGTKKACATSVTALAKGTGGNSCNTGRPAGDSHGFCTDSFDNATYVAGDAASVTFKVTVNGQGELKSIKFWELANHPTTYANGELHDNDYPTKFGVRIVDDVTGTELYKVSNLNTSRAWTQQTIDLTAATTLTYNGIKTFRIELLAYAPIGNGFEDKIWDLDEIQVMASCSAIATVSAGTDVTICSGASTTLNGKITGGTAPYTYLWSPATGLSNLSIANPVASPTITTTYTLTVTDANGCVNTDAVKVIVNTKPKAGSDQTLACANAATNTLTTATTLVPVTSGGIFTQIGSTPAVATITGNAVSGMNVAGTYQFQYSVSGCLDTVAVTVSPCTGCVKPIVGSPVATPSTCTGATANSDAKVDVSSILGGDKYSFGTTNTGFSYSSATAYTGSSIIVGNLANPTSSTTYYVRVYNGVDSCYTDVQTTLSPVSCGTSCGTPNCMGVTVKKN